MGHRSSLAIPSSVFRAVLSSARACPPAAPSGAAHCCCLRSPTVPFGKQGSSSVRVNVRREICQRAHLLTAPAVVLMLHVDGHTRPFR